MTARRIAAFLAGLFWAGLDITLLGLAGVSLLGLLGVLWLPLDNLAHFRVQYLVLLAVQWLIYGFCRHRRRAGMALAFALLNLALVLPLYSRPVSAYADSAAPVNRLLVANILRNNTQCELVSRLIQETNPDLVLFNEFTPTWQAALAAEISSFPYTILFPDAGYFGIAVLSKYPLENSRAEYFGGAPVLSIVTTVHLPAGQLTLIGTHPVPPRSAQATTWRNQEMAAIADYAGSLAGGRMVAGDLNSSSWSPFFWDWLRRSGLSDSRLGFGVQPSWPADQAPLLRLALFTTLDHVLVSPEISVRSRATGAFTGSDHLPVILDFSLTPLTDKDLP